MVDFYKKKQRMVRELTMYLLKLQEEPEQWDPVVFERFVLALAADTGFSQRVIYNELEQLGLVYNKRSRLLERSISAYDRAVKQEGM